MKYKNLKYTSTIIYLIINVNFSIGQAMFDCQPKYQSELEAAAAINDKCRYYRAMIKLSECVSNHPECDNNTKQTLQRELPKYRQEAKKVCNEVSEGLENKESQNYEGATERTIIDARLNFANDLNNVNNAKYNNVHNELSNIEREVDRYRDDPFKNLEKSAGSDNTKNLNINDLNNHVFGTNRSNDDVNDNIKSKNQNAREYYQKTIDGLKIMKDDYNAGNENYTKQIKSVLGGSISYSEKVFNFFDEKARKVINDYPTDKIKDIMVDIISKGNPIKKVPIIHANWAWANTKAIGIFLNGTFNDVTELVGKAPKIIFEDEKYDDLETIIKNNFRKALIER